MEFHILGSLQALDDRQDITPRGAKQRALLGVLLLHANETLTTDRLIDEPTAGSLAWQVPANASAKPSRGLAAGG
jgi:DNA-binding SARP family transcriptional activator